MNGSGPFYIFPLLPRPDVPFLIPIPRPARGLHNSGGNITDLFSTYTPVAPQAVPTSTLVRADTGNSVGKAITRICQTLSFALHKRGVWNAAQHLTFSRCRSCSIIVLS